MKKQINVYTLSDNHFLYWKINEYCERGFASASLVKKKMMNIWNGTVSEGDIVIYVGDFVFTKGESSELIKMMTRLKGRKILVCGNHDRKTKNFYETNGIAFCCDKVMRIVQKQKILFVHKPQHIVPSDLENNNIIVHGHLHNKGCFQKYNEETGTLILNVSVEQINYTPLNLNKIVEMYRKVRCLYE